MIFARSLRCAAAAAAFLITTAPARADVEHGDWLKSAFRTKDAPARKGKSGGAGSSSASSWSGSGSGGETGIASYYWQPQAVASGGRFNPNALTAAHKTLPFGTRVRVTNMNNGRSVEVVINDRGPYVQGRVIDLSRRAAQDIGMTGAGLARVSIARL
jgi:rare lipoprotein A